VRVLTIDTATTASCVGVVVDGLVAAEEAIRAPNAAQHSLAAVERVLRVAGLVVGDLDRVAVGRGPGSFTGLRIGLATALGLAAPGRMELVGVPTTAALRAAAGPAAFAVVDARRGEVFAEGPDLALGAYAPDALAERLPVGALLVGDGAIAHRARFAGCDVPAEDSPLHLPSATWLAALGAASTDAIYVRAPDAEPRP
jgi:tRNA threonylcarbamoyladenosine biosynthesis protein TsaB